jgi:hypothetical protein
MGTIVEGPLIAALSQSSKYTSAERDWWAKSFNSPYTIFRLCGAAMIEPMRRSQY